MMAFKIHNLRSLLLLLVGVLLIVVAEWMIEHYSAPRASAESHYVDALQVHFSDRTASSGSSRLRNPRLAAAAATGSAIFKDWEEYGYIN